MKSQRQQRLLNTRLLSPFAEKDKRVTTELASERNRFVAAISHEVLISYAAPGSKTEALALSLLAAGKRLCTFDDRPGSLLDAGANVVLLDYFSSRATVPAPVGGEQ
jgi:predicted Rossmann fold nucleotide-binding protein DprA/Smf involved in DNA uptake